MEESQNINQNEYSQVCTEAVPVSDEEELYQFGSMFNQRKKQVEEITANTQQILNYPKVKGKSKDGRNVKGAKSKQRLVQEKQKKFVMENQLYHWLKSYWQSHLTLLLMNEFLKEMKSYCMKNAKGQMFKSVIALSKIMKEFILSQGDLNLTNVSFELFDAWILNAGLSTTYSTLQATVTVSDLDDTFFCVFSKIVIQHEEQEEDQLGFTIITITIPSLQSLEPICILSTNVHTHQTRADANQSNTSKSLPKSTETKTLPKDLKKSLHKKSKLKKQQLNLNKKPVESQPESLPESQSESEPETQCKKKKVSLEDHGSSTDDGSDLECSQSFSSLLNDIVQARSSTISQSIFVQDKDKFITLKSPGMSGKWVMKFDIYPYSACARNDNHYWWRYAEMRSIMVISGEDSTLGVLMNQMKKEVIKQMMQCKGFESELKSASSKRGWQNRNEAFFKN